jgi:hypothetical protein
VVGEVGVVNGADLHALDLPGLDFGEPGKRQGGDAAVRRQPGGGEVALEGAREFVPEAEADAWAAPEPIDGDCEVGADGGEVAKDGLVEGADRSIETHGDEAGGLNDFASSGG